MTVDALLAIALGVALPFAMAIAAGILAVKALPPEQQVSRNAWIALFVLLTVAGIVLAFAQQVLLTKEQKEADDKASARELRMVGDTKFTQGQLDSINKVLTAVISGSEKSKSGDVGLVKELLKALQAQTGNAGNQQQPYSNSQLRDAALDLARRLREFQKSTADALQNISDTYRQRTMTAMKNNDKQEADRIFNQYTSDISNLYNGDRSDFVGLRAEALNMRTQLLNRLPPQAENQRVKDVLDKGSLAGVYPVYEVATYFERLARLLPEK